MPITEDDVKAVQKTKSSKKYTYAKACEYHGLKLNDFINARNGFGYPKFRGSLANVGKKSKNGTKTTSKARGRGMIIRFPWQEINVFEQKHGHDATFDLLLFTQGVIGQCARIAKQ